MDGEALVPVLPGIADRDAELRRLQAIGQQLLRRGVVGDIIRERQAREGIQVVCHPVRVQGPSVRKVDVAAADADAVLVIDRRVVGGAGERDLLRLGDGGDAVVQDQVPERGVKLLHGVVGHEVDLPVPQGEVALGVQLAVVPQGQGIGPALRPDGDAARRIAEAVLPQVPGILNGKGRPQLLQGLQQGRQLLPVHGERLVALIDPAVPLPAEGEAAALIGPGQGGDALRIDGKDGLAALPDRLLPGLAAAQEEHRQAERRKDRQQDRELCGLTHPSFSSFPPP